MNKKELAKRAKYMLRFLPDETYIKLYFRLRMGKPCNLDNPKTFNEKLQWLKLYDRRPEYTDMVDKCEAKTIAARVIGAEHIVPTLGVYDRFEDIDFDKLPNSFVLKCTHDSEGLVIVRDKTKFDQSEAEKKLKQAMGYNFFWIGREWPYKNVRPRIIAEEYLESAGGGSKTTSSSASTGSQRPCSLPATGREDEQNSITSTWNTDPLASGSTTPTASPPQSAHSGLPIWWRRAELLRLGTSACESISTRQRGNGTSGSIPSTTSVALRHSSQSGGIRSLGNGLSFDDPAFGNNGLPGLIDYKFYCFGGEPRFLYVSQGLEDHAIARISFLTLDWDFAPFQREDYPGFRNLPGRPRCYDEMLEIARRLSSSIPFVRIDLYEHEGKALFSEATFFPCSGFMRFTPESYDEIFGGMLDLPIK